MVRKADVEIMPLGDDEMGHDVNPEEREISEVLAELGASDDAVVNIYRTIPGRDGRGGEYVDTVHPSMFSLSWLRDTYGPGTYRVHVRSGGKLIGNRAVKIAEPRGLAPVHGMPTVPIQAGADKLEKLVETMNSGFQHISTILAQALSQMAQRPPEKTTLEMLQEMKMMREIFAPPAQALVGLDPLKSFELFKQGIEFAKEILPREGEPTPTEILMDAVKTFGPAIVDAVKHQQQLSMSTPATPTPHVETAAQSLPPPKQEDENVMLIKFYLQQLIKLASENRDPGLYAELIYDQAPADLLRQIVELPDPVQYLAAFNADVLQHRVWFEELASALKDLINSENAAMLAETSAMEGVNAVGGSAAGSVGNDS